MEGLEETGEVFWEPRALGREPAIPCGSDESLQIAFFQLILTGGLREIETLGPGCPSG